jgi:putative tricarboxylic transport membrane protein
MSQPQTAGRSLKAARPARAPRPWTDPQTQFLVALTVLFAVYTAMAMGMDWTSSQGRLAAGFFPRIIGFLALLLCVIALVKSVRQSLRRSAVGEAPRVPEAAEDDGVEGQYPRALLAVVLCSVVFFFLFEPLGATLSSVVFLGATLSILNRGNHVVNAAVAILLPAFLYLLFSVLLDAGMPGGFLNLG